MTPSPILEAQSPTLDTTLPPIPVAADARQAWLAKYLPWTADHSPDFRPVNSNASWKSNTSRDLWGGPWAKLAPLMADPSLNEIQVQALGDDARKLTVITDGPRGVLIHPELEMTPDELANGLRTIAGVGLALAGGIRSGARSSKLEAEVIVNCNLDDGPRESRLTAVLPPSSNAPLLAIRRFPVAGIPLDVFVGEAELQRLTHPYAFPGIPFPEQEKPLIKLFRESEAKPEARPKASCSYQALWWVMAQFEREQNLVVFGSTGSGKTSALQSFLSLTDPNKRCISVQKDANELFLHHLNRVALFATDEHKDAKRAPGRILEAILRLTPDILPYGELRGAETYSYLNANSSGHPGMTTVHAKNESSVLDRLLSMAMSGAPQGSTSDDVKRLVYSSANILIHVKRESFKDRTTGRIERIRRVRAISELVHDPEENKAHIHKIFHTVVNDDGLPTLQWTGHPGTLLGALEDEHLPVPRWFKDGAIKT